MSGARTRRQAALAAAADETPTKTAPEPAAPQKAFANGNGAAHASAAETTRAPEPKENIFLFAPNLIGEHHPFALRAALLPLRRTAHSSRLLNPLQARIANPTPGYVRIVLAILSLYYMPLHPRTCSLLYSISCLLDALDGYAARYYEQSTRFGAVLDMVTDRCTTSCLLVFLSSAFPRWAIIFQGLISLDFASHYIHMYTTLVMGGAEQSHKDVDKNRSWILSLYYTNKVRRPQHGRIFPS